MKASLVLSLLFGTLFFSAAVGDGSLKLQGSLQSYAQVPGFEYGGSFTIETWLKVNAPPALGSFPHIFDFLKLDSDAFQGILLGLSNDPHSNVQVHLYFPGASAGEQVHARDVIFPTGNWTHVAITVQVSGPEGNQVSLVTLYLNARPVAEALFRGVMETVARGYSFIGRSNWPNDGSPNVNIDEFRIWSVWRSPDEIATAMNYKIRTALPGLEANYGFDTTATALRDLSGKAHNLVLFNGAAYSAEVPPTRTGTPTAVTVQPGPLCTGAEVKAQLRKVSLLQTQLVAEQRVLENLVNTCRG
mmetsp:Transcript_30915/g.50015  ORF Transcript_30915/g.50015 Transcript_30915/m.50015 type:complete len:302 (-) Transcript_30915:46-951(-)|eukprot:CAMPEP_0184674754 /NCGR_PEP_ID=MMETSP0308-20130426/87411_1 /TAXON_ID=38269 /ORGANISM="Gloeochaete witrockiana, Strain SAG 46.84" /LENGTH=301 /DNA_ID=CAMNT_0027122399 /DNA_START=204 /DNA_END=1109 /DNA_ORIENTATION=-